MNASEAASPVLGRMFTGTSDSINKGLLICSLGMVPVALSLRSLSSFFSGFT